MVDINYDEENIQYYSMGKTKYKKLFEDHEYKFFKKIYIIGELENTRAGACLHEGDNELKELVSYMKSNLELDSAKKSEQKNLDCLVIVEEVYYRANKYSLDTIPSLWKQKIVPSDFFKTCQNKEDRRKASNFFRSLLAE